MSEKTNRWRWEEEGDGDYIVYTQPTNEFTPDKRVTIFYESEEVFDTIYQMQETRELLSKCIDKIEKMDWFIKQGMEAGAMVTRIEHMSLEHENQKLKAEINRLNMEIEHDLAKAKEVVRTKHLIDLTDVEHAYLWYPKKDIRDEHLSELLFNYRSLEQATRHILEVFSVGALLDKESIRESIERKLRENTTLSAAIEIRNALEPIIRAAEELRSHRGY